MTKGGGNRTKQNVTIKKNKLRSSQKRDKRVLEANARVTIALLLLN